MKIQSLSVVLPLYNQEHCLIKNLSSLLHFLKSNVKDYEVVVVDDASTDKTFELLKRFKERVRVLRNEQNKGKGFSVKKGLLASTKDWALFTDIDLSIPLEAVPELWRFHRTHEVVIASRAAEGGKIFGPKPILRVILGRLFPFLVRWFVLSGIIDTQCGCKLFSRHAIKAIFNRQTIDRYGFDVEVLLIAKRHNLLIKEVGVSVTNRDSSTLSPFKHSLQMLSELARIKWNDIKGLYG